jgi:hypothetical protein
MAPFLKRLAELFMLSRELLDPHTASGIGEATKQPRRRTGTRSAEETTRNRKPAERR